MTVMMIIEFKFENYLKFFYKINMINSNILSVITESIVDIPDENNESPIKYLDNDVLNNVLPEYVAKMRKKVWWENLINNLLYCDKGVYSDGSGYIIGDKFPPSECIEKDKLFSFSSVLGECEDRLESLFIKEYGCSDRNPIPKMDVDYIPFYNLFCKLTGQFKTYMLFDHRLNNSYPNLTKYYEYLTKPDNYLKNIKEHISLRYKNIIPYTKKLTFEDKDWLINVLKEYYHIINTVKSLDKDSWYSYCYDLDENMNKIKKNIEKIKSM